MKPWTEELLSINEKIQRSKALTSALHDLDNSSLADLQPCSYATGIDATQLHPLISQLTGFEERKKVQRGVL